MKKDKYIIHYSDGTKLISYGFNAHSAAILSMAKRINGGYPYNIDSIETEFGTHYIYEYAVIPKRS